MTFCTDAGKLQGEERRSKSNETKSRTVSEDVRCVVQDARGTATRGLGRCVKHAISMATRRRGIHMGLCHVVCDRAKERKPLHPSMWCHGYIQGYCMCG